MKKLTGGAEQRLYKDGIKLLEQYANFPKAYKLLRLTWVDSKPGVKLCEYFVNDKELTLPKADGSFSYRVGGTGILRADLNFGEESSRSTQRYAYLFALAPDSVRPR